MRYNILFLFCIIFGQLLIPAVEGSITLSETSNVYERVCSVSVCGSLVIRSELATDLVNPSWHMSTGVISKIPLRIQGNHSQVIYLEKDPLVATGVNGILSYLDIYRGIKVTFVVSLPFNFGYHWNYFGVNVGSLKENITFDTGYQSDFTPNYRYLTGKNVMGAVMHEFYSKDGIECIKVEFLLGSNHNCVIELILSECYVESLKRISYYTTLDEKYEGFGIPT